MTNMWAEKKLRIRSQISWKRIYISDGANNRNRNRNRMTTAVF